MFTKHHKTTNSISKIKKNSTRYQSSKPRQTNCGAGFKKYFILSIILMALVSFAFTNQIFAADSIIDNLKGAGTGAQYSVGAQSSDEAIPNMIGQIVAVVLSFVGAIFLILTIYSGLQWMTAGGNEEKVTKARTRLINATLGLVITVAAYFITYLISSTLLN